MINCYDLYDLHYVFLAIRAYPNNELNGQILSSVIDVLRNNYDNLEFNQLRKALRKIDSIEKSQLRYFVFTENVYTYYPMFFMKDKYLYEVLIESCSRLLKAVNEKNEKKIYALSDLLENLPLILFEEKYTLPKSFWKFVNYYRKEWDNKFLVSLQKHK